jgi:E1A-binding protein p400
MRKSSAVIRVHSGDRWILSEQSVTMCSQQQPLSPNEDKVALGALETALAAAEDESDVQAARTAKAEAAADLAEFDETIPLEDGETGEQEMSKAELEVHNLIQQVCDGSTSVVFQIST